MKTITFKGKKTKLYADDIECLRVLKSNDFIAKQSLFEKGSGRNKNTRLPRVNSGTAKLLGISFATKGFEKNAKEKAFFKQNPRCTYAVVGNPRRINALLAAMVDAHKEIA